MSSYRLFHGDCLDKLKDMPDNSVDSIVTDPPYGLSKEPDMKEVMQHWLAGDDYKHKSAGFMGKEWDSFVPGPAIWSECLRVLKPGGHMLAFFGTRTYDMGVLAIRLAGFEIRNQIAWVYGGGMPKALDVSKAIDKHFGAERKVISSTKTNSGGYAHISKTNKEQGFRPTAYKGHSTDDSAANVINETEPATPEALQWDGWKSDLKPAFEPIVVARKPLGEKTIAENVLKWGVGALNIDDCRVPIDPTVDDPRLGGKGSWDTKNAAKNVYEGGYAGDRVTSSAKGRFPANLIHDGSPEVLEHFPDSKAGGNVSGNEPSQTGGENTNCYGEYGRVSWEGYNDSGSAARFFYCAKTSKTDRNEGLEEFPDIEWKGENTPIPERKNRPFNPTKNDHPTVKPTKLMQYLVKMVTPPNGTVLDPFMGSGSTGKAAMIEGFNFLGIEMQENFVAISKSRIEYGIKLREQQKKPDSASSPVKNKKISEPKKPDIFNKFFDNGDNNE